MVNVLREVKRPKPSGPAAPPGFCLGTSRGTIFTIIPPWLFQTMSQSVVCSVYCLGCRLLCRWRPWICQGGAGRSWPPCLPPTAACRPWLCRPPSSDRVNSKVNPVRFSSCLMGDSTWKVREKYARFFFGFLTWKVKSISHFSNKKYFLDLFWWFLTTFKFFLKI